MNKYLLLCLLTVGTTVTPGSAAQGPNNGDEALLTGVNHIAAPGIPGPLCLFADRAFPIVDATLGRSVRAPVVAAANCGGGRVVAFGHTGYLDVETLAQQDTDRLLKNAIRWTARRKDCVVGVLQNPQLREHLAASGLQARNLNNSQLDSELARIDVLCLQPARLRSAAHIESVEAFVRGGGGLIAADLGWGWLQLNPGKTLAQDHPGNRLLHAAGIAWADGYLEKTEPTGYVVEPKLSPLLHLDDAADALKVHSETTKKLTGQQLSQAVSTIMRCVRTLPDGPDVIAARLADVAAPRRAAIPTPKNPLSVDKHPVERLLLSIELERAEQLPADQVRPHPASAEFPGAVADGAETVTRTIRVDTEVLGWHSTGLYAPPGKLITVRSSPQAAKRGLRVRIGAHSDRLWGKDRWNRCPDVCRTFAIQDSITQAANSFGGLVYIDVPRRVQPETIEVTIQGAVEAPLYVHGETDITSWRDSIRSGPAPWAELQSQKVTLTVPSSSVRDLDDPAELMDFWDGVMDACADLAGWSRDRPRPERYVTDVQISAGYMHSGYPIMTHLDMADVVVDKKAMTSNSHGGVWGLFHETGHNHQSGDWTFQGTGEVTVNLFTIYVLEQACGLDSNAHPSFTKKVRATKRRRYVSGGADFEQWKRDPFLALDMYILMKEEFGWDAFKKTFSRYRELSARDRPRTDDDKRDQWLTRFSRTVGRNLGPYFRWWGVPVSATALDAVSDLPVWMPSELPAKKSAPGP